MGSVVTRLSARCPIHGRRVALTVAEVHVEVDGDGAAWACWRCLACDATVRDRVWHGPALRLMQAAGVRIVDTTWSPVVVPDPLTAAEVDAWTAALDDDDLVGVHVACLRRERS